MAFSVSDSKPTRHENTKFTVGVYSTDVTITVLFAERNPTDERTRVAYFTIYSFSILTVDLTSDEDNAI